MKEEISKGKVKEVLRMPKELKGILYELESLVKEN